MKHLEIPNCPDDLYERIETLGQARGVSVDILAIQLLRQAISAEDAEMRLMAEVKRGREELAAKGVWITDEFITEAKRWGRK